MLEIKELREVEPILAANLETENGHQLAAQLSEAESWGAYVSKLTYDAKAELAKMREKYRMPKTQGTTDFDRGIMLDAATADWDAKYEYLAQIQEAIKRRITLGQSLLRVMRAEIESNI